MKVVGGVYRERCAIPSIDAVVGSGLRAAALLRAVDPGIVLNAAIDDRTRPPLDAVVAGLSLQAPVGVSVVARTEPVGFSYFTPLSNPAIDGARSEMADLVVEGDSVLVFRMIEGGSCRVRARSVVLDPQQPRDLAELDLDRIQSERLAIVANTAETVALGGYADHQRDEAGLVEAARAMLVRYSAEVVVVKRAAAGSLVVTQSTSDTVGVFPTETVYPIGSGDAFAAAFAWAWAADMQDPVAAARVGSRVAAEWCRTRSLWIPPEIFQPDAQIGELRPRPVRVYLAAPFFELGQRWIVELVRDGLRSLGADVFSPLHDVGEGGDDVAQADLDGLAQCDAVLALLDGDDPGTLFEAGWARNAGKPVVGYGHRMNVDGGKMLRGSGAEVCSDLSTAVYRAIWAGMRNG